jgi:PhoH-like ATPase
MSKLTKKKSAWNKPILIDPKFKKIFVLDTNIPMLYEKAFSSFGENAVIFPISCVEEIDRIKRDPLRSARFDARRVFRELKEMLLKDKSSSYVTGVDLDNGGKLYIITNGYDWDMLPESLEKSTDNMLLLLAMSLKKNNPNAEVILVSNDGGVFVKANSLGIVVQEFEREKINQQTSDIPSGVVFLTINQEDVFEDLCTNASTGQMFKCAATVFANAHNLQKLTLNSGCIISCSDDLSFPMLALYKGEDKEELLFKRVEYTSAYGKSDVVPKNNKQALCVAMALDKNVDVVTVGGPPGTGKTLMMVMAGLMLKKQFPRVAVFRSHVEGIDEKPMGYAPGTREEKYEPWTVPIRGSLRKLLGGTSLASDEINHDKGTHDPVKEYLERGFVTVQPLNYLRGCTVDDAVIIVDDAQNLTKSSMDLIMTRAGENTKIVLVYDYYQIDTPNLNWQSTGVARIIANYPGQSNYAHIVLTDIERGPLVKQYMDLCGKA